MINIYRSFVKEIKSGKIKKTYLLYGSERYLLDKGLEEIKNHVVTAFEEMNYMVFEGKNIDMSDVLNACETLPFGSDKKLVVVKDFQGLKSKTKKDEAGDIDDSNDSAKQDNLSFVENLSDDVCLLFINYDGVDKRKKLYKEIKKNGSIFEFEKIDKRDLRQWIENFFRREGKEINPQEIECFIQNTGYTDRSNNMNMYHVYNEMEKILSYMGEERAVKREHLEALLHEPLENNVFKLIDACWEGDVSKSLKVYNELLLEGESSYSIIALISWGIKSLIKIKELKEEGINAKGISNKVKMKEFVVSRYLNHCNKIGHEKLRKALERCLKCETNIKTGRQEEKLAVEMLLTSLFQ